MTEDDTDLLIEAVQNGFSVTIVQEGTGRLFTGFPLSLSDHLLLIRQIVDFRLEGYTIIKMQDIAGVFAEDAEHFREKVLHDRGLSVGGYPSIFIENWSTVFRGITTTARIIELEFLDKTEGNIVGEVVRVDSQSVTLRVFDAAAKWLGYMPIAYSAIGIVYFDDHYTKTYAEYLPLSVDIQK